MKPKPALKTSDCGNIRNARRSLPENELSFSEASVPKRAKKSRMTSKSARTDMAGTDEVTTTLSLATSSGSLTPAAKDNCDDTEEEADAEAEDIQFLIKQRDDMKEELAKNREYIINQKNHYDLLVAQEKSSVKLIQTKYDNLEKIYNKLWESYETLNQTNKSLQTSSKTNQELKKAKETILNLEAHVSCLRKEVEGTVKVCKPSVEFLLQKSVIYETYARCLKNKLNAQKDYYIDLLAAHMKTSDELKRKLRQLETFKRHNKDIGQPSQILRDASKYLGKSQLAWLEAQLLLSRCNTHKHKPLWVKEFKEMVVYMYEQCPAFYNTCRRVLTLPSEKLAAKWRQEECQNSTVVATSSSVTDDAIATKETDELYMEIHKFKENKLDLEDNNSLDSQFIASDLNKTESQLYRHHVSVCKKWNDYEGQHSFEGESSGDEGIATGDIFVEFQEESSDGEEDTQHCTVFKVCPSRSDREGIAIEKVLEMEDDVSGSKVQEVSNNSRDNFDMPIIETDCVVSTCEDIHTLACEEAPVSG